MDTLKPSINDDSSQSKQVFAVDVLQLSPDTVAILALSSVLIWRTIKFIFKHLNRLLITRRRENTSQKYLNESSTNINHEEKKDLINKKFPNSNSYLDEAYTKAALAFNKGSPINIAPAAESNLGLYSRPSSRLSNQSSNDSRQSQASSDRIPSTAKCIDTPMRKAPLLSIKTSPTFSSLSTAIGSPNSSPLIESQNYNTLTDYTTDNHFLMKSNSISHQGYPKVNLNNRTTNTSTWSDNEDDDQPQRLYAQVKPQSQKLSSRLWTWIFAKNNIVKSDENKRANRSKVESGNSASRRDKSRVRSDHLEDTSIFSKSNQVEYIDTYYKALEESYLDPYHQNHQITESEVNKTKKMFGSVANPPDLSKDTPDREISVEELSQYDGSDPSKPIYLAVKGIIYDVSPAREMYGNGSGYSLFAGKDASCALGKSSLNAEDCHSDISNLTSEELKVLDDWANFYRRKYNVVGKVVY